MTEALTRAARAGDTEDASQRIEVNLWGDDMRGLDEFVDGRRSVYRAAILAFLNGKDVVEAMARAICDDPCNNENLLSWTGYINRANAAIAALRALVQEDGK